MCSIASWEIQHLVISHAKWHTVCTRIHGWVLILLRKVNSASINVNIKVNLLTFAKLASQKWTRIALLHMVEPLFVELSVAYDLCKSWKCVTFREICCLSRHSTGPLVCRRRNSMPAREAAVCSPFVSLFVTAKIWITLNPNVNQVSYTLSFWPI